MSTPQARHAVVSLEADAQLMRAWLGALPKAELHVHLEGAVPPQLALELAHRHGLVLPGSQGGLEGLTEAYRFRNFGDFIRLYVAISRCFAEAIDFEDAVVGVAQQFAAQGIAYAELTFTPMTHIARGVDADAMLDGLAAGRQRAFEEHGVRIAWVFDIVRSFPDQAPPTLELALRARRRDVRVLALGIGGPEGEAFATAPFVEVFAQAKAQGFFAVPHAGEQWGPQSVREAVELLKADRIGHGVRAIEDPQLVELLAERQIPLEVCPGSNLTLGVYDSLEAHPITRLRDAGVAINLASDDPALFQLDLVSEYFALHSELGWGALELHQLACAAIDHSFLPAADKRDLRTRMQAHRPVA